MEITMFIIFVLCDLLIVPICWFSFGKNSACAAGLAVGTLCMGVGLYLV